MRTNFAELDRAARGIGYPLTKAERAALDEMVTERPARLRGLAFGR